MSLTPPSLVQLPWASSGDTNVPPVGVDPNGFASFTTGYTEDYEIDLLSGNPKAKAVDRLIQNYLFGLATSNIQWWQGYGLATWYAGFPNGYDIRALVMRQGADGTYRPYRSLVANNVSDPLTTPTQWEYQQSSAEMVLNIPMPSGGTGGPSFELITGAVDFNTIVVSGTWEVSTDATAAACPNSPVPLAGVLEAKQYGANLTMQRYTARNGRIYIRGGNNGNWLAWLTGVVVSGDTMTGVLALQAGGTTTGAPQFNVSTLIANTAFVQQAVGNKRSVIVLQGTVNVTMDNSYYGTAVQVLVGSGVTLTLPPPPANALAGQSILFYHQGPVAATIAAPAGGFLYAPNAGVPVNTPSLVLNPGETIEITNRGGGEYDVTDGSWLVTHSLLSFITQPQYDSSKAVATTEFTQRSLGNNQAVFAYSTNQAITIAQAGSIIRASAAGLTFNLPILSTFPRSGASYEFVNNSGGILTLALSNPTTDNFLVGATSAKTVVLQSGDSIKISAFPTVFVCTGVGTLQFNQTNSTTAPFGDSSQRISDTAFVQAAVSSAVPSGVMMPFAGQVAPSGYLLANGAAVSRTTFANLFSAIGTVYGVGDGSTTFNLPDTRGVAIRGFDNGRGLDPGRAFGSFQSDVIVSHNHGISDPGHNHGVFDPGHAHSISDSGHNHGVNDPGHSHAVPYGATPGSAAGTTGGPGASTAAFAGTTGSGTGIFLNASGTGIGINGSVSNVAVNTNVTGITTTTTGSVETRMKNLAVTYIIKT